VPLPISTCLLVLAAILTHFSGPVATTLCFVALGLAVGNEALRMVLMRPQAPPQRQRTPIGQEYEIEGP
jgi:hypothetical protein